MNSVGGPNSVARENDLGILFVHGIGQQAAGETLVAFGDPLLKWIDEWFWWSMRWELAKWANDQAPKKSGNESGTKTNLDAADIDVRLRKAKLKDEVRAILNLGTISVDQARIQCEEGIPAHATVELRVGPDGAARSKRWLVAESCWANAFLAPTFTELAFWGLVVYPWTNATHYGAQLRRLWDRTSARNPIAILKSSLMTGIYFLGSVAVSIAVVAVLLMLLVLAIPPIPNVREMVLRVQQRLGNSLGDSFILAASPLQRAAILSQVQRDLKWLLQNCDKIAIVAHSQGAAVVFETLSRGILKGRDLGKTLLITFGSGLSKLREVERAVTSGKAMLGWAPIIGLTMITASLELFGIINAMSFVGVSIYWGIFCAVFGSLFWLGGIIASTWEERLNPEDYMPSKMFGTEIVWRDYYASEDPVSNGPLFDPNQRQEFLVSAEIHNRAAPWSDHTTYWRNRDEFVPRLVGDLSDFSELPLLDTWAGDQERVEKAARRRAARVRWLAGVRTGTWIVAGLIIITRMTSLPTWGAALLERVPVAEKVLKWIGVDAVMDDTLVGAPVVRYVAGIALVIGIVAAAYHMLYFIWHIWTWFDVRALIRREQYGLSAPHCVFILASLTLANLGVLVSLDWWSIENPPSSEFRRVVFALLMPGALAFFALLLPRVGKYGRPIEVMAMESAVAALLVAPIMAVVVLTDSAVSAKLGSLLALAILAGVLIVRVGPHLLLEPSPSVSSSPGGR